VVLFLNCFDIRSYEDCKNTFVGKLSNGQVQSKSEICNLTHCYRVTSSVVQQNEVTEIKQVVIEW